MPNSRDLPHSKNIARGKAHVGMQIGYVGGNVSSGSPPSDPVLQDLLGQLTVLRERLDQLGAHENTDYARDVIATAEQVAQQDSGPSRRVRLMEAMGKLKDVLLGVAGLGSSIDTVIETVKKLG